MKTSKLIVMSAFFSSYLIFSIPVLAIDTINLGAEDSWPPFSLADGTGISNLLVVAAYQAVGIDVSIGVAPYARILAMVKAGTLDGGFNVTRQPTTESVYQFGDLALLEASSAFYYKPDQDMKYKSLKDIRSGTRIGIIRGYEYGPEFEEQKGRFECVPVTSQKQIIVMLLKGRTQVALMFTDIYDYTMQTNKNMTALVRGDIVYTSRIYVAFHKGPKGLIAAKKLDQGLELIQKNGLYAKILAKIP